MTLICGCPQCFVCEPVCTGDGAAAYQITLFDGNNAGLRSVTERLYTSGSTACLNLAASYTLSQTSPCQWTGGDSRTTVVMTNETNGSEFITFTDIASSCLITYQAQLPSGCNCNIVVWYTDSFIYPYTCDTCVDPPCGTGDGGFQGSFGVFLYYGGNCKWEFLGLNTGVDVFEVPFRVLLTNTSGNNYTLTISNLDGSCLGTYTGTLDCTHGGTLGLQAGSPSIYLPSITLHVATGFPVSKFYTLINDTCGCNNTALAITTPANKQPMTCPCPRPACGACTLLCPGDSGLATQTLSFSGLTDELLDSGAVIPWSRLNGSWTLYYRGYGARCSNANLWPNAWLDCTWGWTDTNVTLWLGWIFQTDSHSPPDPEYGQWTLIANVKRQSNTIVQGHSTYTFPAYSPARGGSSWTCHDPQTLTLTSDLSDGAAGFPSTETVTPAGNKNACYDVPPILWAHLAWVSGPCQEQFDGLSIPLICSQASNGIAIGSTFGYIGYWEPFDLGATARSTQGHCVSEYHRSHFSRINGVRRS